MTHSSELYINEWFDIVLKLALMGSTETILYIDAVDSNEAGISNVVEPAMKAFKQLHPEIAITPYKGLGEAPARPYQYPYYHASWSLEYKFS
jgi:hypothetical protein